MTNQQAEIGTSLEDPYLWLEEVEGERALAWVREHNKSSRDALEEDRRFATLLERAKRILNAPERIPYVRHENGRVHNFWRDETNVRGLLRCADLDAYRAGEPQWETVLDIDALARDEEEDWVYGGCTWRAPEHDRGVMRLSRGGSDAVVLREFDMATKRFVEDGFILPEGKQSVAWLDRDRLIVITGHGGGGYTTAGYARSVRIWQRGTAIEDSQLVYEIPEEDAMVFAVTMSDASGSETFIIRRPDFFTQELRHLSPDGETTRLQLPHDTDFKEFLDGHLLLSLRSDWAVGGTVHTGGSIVSVPLADLISGREPGVETVVPPIANGSVQNISVVNGSALIETLTDVTGSVDRITRVNGTWRSEPVNVPVGGALYVTDADRFSDLAFVNYEDFLTPPTLYLVTTDEEVDAVKQLPQQFDAGPFAVEQHFATSADGARIPYFLVCARDREGPVPTVLYGYGGFEVSVTPSYATAFVSSWLESGGAYVVANIRGGGEYGPAWHKAALKEHRQRAFDDFIAVAEDLVACNVTTSNRLGIYGGSNGGLLVGAVMVQRPDLFRAVACAVPLLDMLRYHKLLAGASWIGEYGNPDVDEERAYIEKYSPYQNLKAGRDYPKVFFVTSTKDDRVHPGHARKMAARMLEQDHDVIYYENVDGGHSAAADLLEVARRAAQLAIFFLRELAS